jgi:hypothetical protein
VVSNFKADTSGAMRRWIVHLKPGQQRPHGLIGQATKPLATLLRDAQVHSEENRKQPCCVR